MAFEALLEINVAVRDALRNIDRLQAETTKQVSSINKSFDSLKTVAVAAVGVFAGAQAVNAIRGFVDAANTQEDAINSLNNSLRTAGTFSEEASQQFQDFASELQASTRVGDETTLQLAALARNFTTTNDEALKLTEAAVELSAATGISLESAVSNLGKTFGGLTGELGESVPALRSLSKEALQSGAALDFVLNRFGGSAAAQVQTFSGATEQLGNAFGDLQEQFGFIITQNPQLIAAINEVSRIISELTGEVEDSRGAFSETFGSIVEITASFATSTVSAFAAIGEVIDESKLGYRVLAEAIVRSLNAPFRAFSRFESFIAETFANIVVSSSNFVNGLIDQLKRIPGIERFIPQVNDAQNSLNEFTGGIVAGLNAISDEADKAKAPLEDLERAAVRATAEQILANQEYIDSANAVVQSFADAEQRIIAAGNSTTQFSRQVERSSSQATNAVQNISKEAQDAAKKQEESFQKLVAEIEKAERSTRPLENQLTQLGVAFADAFNNNEFDKARQIFTEIQSINQKITEEVEKQAEAQRKAADEARRNAVQARENAERQILGAVVGGDGSSQLQVDQLQEEVDVLAAKLNEAGLAEGERVKLQNELAEKQTALADAQNRNLDNSRRLVSTVASTVGEIFLPGFGGIIGQLTDQLARGPEEAAAFITGLIKGIPQIIENIALALPEITIALAESMPEVAAALAVEVPIKLTRALVERAPEIIEAQIRAVPRLVEAFAKAIASQVFNVDFDFSIVQAKFESLVEDFRTSLSTFFGGLGDIFSNFELSITGAGESFFTSVVEGAQRFVEEILSASTGGLLGGDGDGRGLSTGNISIGGLRNSGQDLVDRSGLGGLFLTGGSTQPTGVAGSGLTERQLSSLGDAIGRSVSDTLRDIGTEQVPPLVIQLKLNNSQLSNALVDLRRNGFPT